MAGRFALGIDLGTTYSLAATMVAGAGHQWYPRILSNTVGKELTPSVVFFDPVESATAVGDVALQLWRQAPSNVVRWIKRRMGDDTYRVSITGRDHVEFFSPQQVSAIILQHILAYSKMRAPDSELGTLVITVPAFFGDNERQATLDAARLLGVEANLIEEPTAAILDYLHERVHDGSLSASDGDKYFAVFDLGGGTFDISVALLAWDGDVPVVRIVATQGHRRLGGFDFDLDLAEVALERFAAKYPDKKVEFQRVKAALVDFKCTGHAPPQPFWEIVVGLLDTVESTKRQLSSLPSYRLYFPHSSLLAGGTFYVELRQNDVNAVLGPRLKDIEDRVTLALATAQQNTEGIVSSWSKVERVILVGGSTRIPAVQDLVRKLFGQAPWLDGLEDQAVARGAAIYAGILAGFDIKGNFQRKTVHAYGIVDGGKFVPIIGRGTPYPPAAATVHHSVRFVLSPKAPLKIAQAVAGPNGQEQIEVIRELDYYHPILYTGDRLTVSLEIDTNGLLQARAEDATGERVEERIQSVALDPKERKEQSDQLTHWASRAS